MRWKRWRAAKFLAHNRSSIRDGSKSDAHSGDRQWTGSCRSGKNPRRFLLLRRQMEWGSVWPYRVPSSRPTAVGSGQRITQLAMLHSMYLYPFPPLFRPLMSAKCCRDSSYPVLSVVQPKVPLRESAPVQCSQPDRLREELAPA
jgi:hypothetical protein